MAIETILNSILNEPYMKNMRQSIVDGLEQVYKDATAKGDTNMEVLRARGSSDSLNGRLDEFDASFDETNLVLGTKASVDATWNMANMGQDVREAFTGGAVAVVGKDTVLTDNIVNRQVIPEKTNFLTYVTNLFNSSTIKKGYVHFWTNNQMSEYVETNSYKSEKIKLLKGISYYVFGIRGDFSYLVSLDGTQMIERISTVGSSYKGVIKPSVDCYLYASFYNVIAPEDQYITNTNYQYPTKINYGAYKDVKIFGSYNLEEMKNKLSGSDAKKIVTVKKDGTGDFKTLKSCIESITDATFYNQYLIKIYSGVYDVIEEFGGQSWVTSVVTTNGERQGLVVPDYVDIEGIGFVHIKCEVSDANATLAFSTCVSTLNIWKNNSLTNLLITAKNTRYAVHDETNNQYSFLKRRVENCKIIHYGNKDGLWSNEKAYAIGTGSGGIYNFINSIFDSKKDGAFSAHNNTDQDGNTFNIDGCDFKGNGHPYALAFGYYGTNDTDKVSKVFIKNSKADSILWVHPESSSVASTNVFEIHNHTSLVEKID